MDEKSNYIIYSIPAIPAHHHILQYKELRLRALKTDPEHFSSTYEESLSLGFEEWRARIRSRDKVTIVAATKRLAELSGEPLEPDPQHKWVGMVTIVGPKTLQRFRFTPPRSMQGDGELYCVVGVWVDPDHRRKSLGKMMMESGIDWIQADDVPGQPEAVEKRILLLQVMDINTEAIGLYSSMGFKFVETDESVEDKKLWMYMHLRDK